MAAAKTKDSYTQAQYGRLAPRRGKRKARKAVGHTLLFGIWHMLTTGVLSDDLGADYFDKRRSSQQTGQRKLGDLKSMGWTVDRNDDGTITVIPSRGSLIPPTT